MKRRVLSILLVLCMVTAMLPITTLAEEITWLAFEKLTVTMNLGETLQLKYTATGGEPSFASGNEKIATVDSKGVVTALQTGVVDIRGYVGERRYGTNCTVIIRNDNPVTGLSVPKKIVLNVGETYQLEVKFIPEDGKSTEPLRYTVNDGGTGRVKIDRFGKITAVRGPYKDALVSITMGNVKTTCNVDVNPPEGYVPDEGYKPDTGIPEGWYTIRCMFNYMQIDSKGYAELRNGNPVQTFYVKKHVIEGKKRDTIMTADGRYLGIEGAPANGTLVKALKEPYYWASASTYGLFSIWVPGDGYFLMTARGGSNSSGTPIGLIDNKSNMEPPHGRFMFTPAAGKGKEPTKPLVVPPTTKNPLKLKGSYVKGREVNVFGMTLGQTKVSEMKALYGEPDDTWMNSYEMSGEEVEESEDENYHTVHEPFTYWYAYVNNWKDMVLVATKENIVQGVYTSKVVDFGKDTKLPNNVVRQYIHDEGDNNKGFATWITKDSYIAGPAVSDDGAGVEFGAFEKMFYYTLNSFLSRKGWKMLQLQEIASYNRFKAANARRESGKIYDDITATKLDISTNMYEAWEYLLSPLTNKAFRNSLYSGKYNSIAIGYAQMWLGDINSEIKTKDKFGALVVELQNTTLPKPAAKHPFTDVVPGSYYENAVVWALENNVTGGTSATTFEPKAPCTRGQVVTFLWRSKGCPEPTSSKNPFSDVKTSDYYYKAVLWAAEKGIAGGTGPSSFSPKAPCTSGQVVTFLWRANGSPNKTGKGEYYTDAVNWGNANGLLAGTGKTFAPNNNSPRGDIVTYLYRNAVK